MEHIDDHDAKPIPTIFHDIMVSKLPEREKKLDRLCQEGQTFIVAGTETTAWCLSVICFHLLKDQAKLQRLTKELEGANATTSTELEQLPYLSAVIQEGLRLSYGVSHRLPRIAPDETIFFVAGDKTWRIPPGASSPQSCSCNLPLILIKYRHLFLCQPVYSTKTPPYLPLQRNSSQNAGSITPPYTATSSPLAKAPANV